MNYFSPTVHVTVMLIFDCVFTIARGTIVTILEYQTSHERDSSGKYLPVPCGGDEVLAPAVGAA